MNPKTDFPARALSYSRSYAYGRVLQILILCSVPALAASLIWVLLRESGAKIPLFPALLFCLLPPPIIFSRVFPRENRPERSLSWLDGKTGGRQSLQAAWEFRNSPTVFRGLVLRDGLRFFDSLGSSPERPRPRRILYPVLLFFAAATLMILMMGSPFVLFGAPDPVLMLQGENLVEFAETWAAKEESENHDLARRMKELGRRMADGTLDEPKARRALEDLEERIAERREDLIRDFPAGTGELETEQRIAEMFRIRRRPASGDVPSILRLPMEGSLDDGVPKDSEPSLAADPNRNEGSLSGEIPSETGLEGESMGEGQRELNEAVNRVRDARKSLAGGQEGGEGREESTAGGGGAPDASSSGNEEASSSSEGWGRGDAPAKDHPPKEADDTQAKTLGGVMELPVQSPRGQNWKTVIRAWTGEDDVSISEFDGEAEWRRELESVMYREDIPPRIRNFVKDYFLALEEEPNS